MNTIYKATTRYIGADGTTTRYFKSRTTAEAFIEKAGNIGEIEELNCTIAIEDGMTADEIMYYGGKIR